LRTPFSLVTEGLTEYDAADGRTVDLAHGAGAAHACNLSATTFGFDTAVVLEVGYILGGATLQEVLTVDRKFIRVATKDLNTTSCSVTGGVTHSGATVAHCASLAPPCGLGAIPSLDSAVRKGVGCGCDLGGVPLHEGVVVVVGLIHVTASNFCAGKALEVPAHM